ncbi:GAF domain-containing protein, partial [Staphylococcus hominis]|uniref:GAF domain-containing protein n=1 Tax=Staphylococcus hominis TaxID=1290 RepID=UPI001C92CB2C
NIKPLPYIIPQPFFQPLHFQQQLHTLTKKLNSHFATVALYQNHQPSAPIKSQYLSANLNTPYKFILFTKPTPLPPTLIKTPKRILIQNLSKTITPQEKINYPIFITEN